ncbi:MAG: peptidase M14 [Bacteroidetes bacterium]|nr:peptidase M14 [Bacteroidota bacterium]
MQNFEESLYNSFEKYKEKSLKIRRFKQKDILPLIQKLPFENMVVGHSYEGREIIKVALGQGKRKILLWSQMHGNEATATMAIFDIFNFFKEKGVDFQSEKEEILSNLQLHFIPMLNPDGAERFIRYTAQGIDMNRDALRLQCPESRILKDNVGKLKPEFSFNLHDQGTRYSAGISPKQATVSFLATAYNEAREWNEVRIKSRQVIGHLNAVLQNFIPGGIGRFSDEFEPRAFGDNIQKWGSSLILIESGGLVGDLEKQEIRKLNFVAILSALLAISRENYGHFSLQDYENIPQNEKALFDLKIENAQMEGSGGKYMVDLGINIDEKNNPRATNYTHTSVIEDIGDLSVFFGLKTIDAQGAILKPISQFPALVQKYKIKGSTPSQIELGGKASFVIDYKSGQKVILNGKILD